MVAGGVLGDQEGGQYGDLNIERGVVEMDTYIYIYIYRYIVYIITYYTHTD